MTPRKKESSRLTFRLLVPYAGSEQPHEAFANLRDEPKALETFSKRFGLEERAGRHRWEPGSGQGEESIKSLSPGKWKEVYSIRDKFRKAWHGDQVALRWVEESIKDAEFMLKPYGKHGMAMEAKWLMDLILLLFLRDRATGKLGICANPECQAPYFVRKRKTQKYCTAGPCIEQAQREQKLKWWHRHHGKGGKSR